MASIKELKTKAVKHKILYSDLSTAATTITVGVHTIEDAEYLLHFYPKVTTAFAGVTLPQVKVGVSGDDDLYVPTQPINKVGVLKVGQHASKGFCAGLTHQTDTSPSLQATFTSSSGNLSSLSAGEIEFVAVYAYEE